MHRYFAKGLNAKEALTAIKKGQTKKMIIYIHEKL